MDRRSLFAVTVCLILATAMAAIPAGGVLGQSDQDMPRWMANLARKQHKSTLSGSDRWAVTAHIRAGMPPASP